MESRHVVTEINRINEKHVDKEKVRIPDRSKTLSTRERRRAYNRRKSVARAHYGFNKWLSPVAMIMAIVLFVVSVGGISAYAIWYNSFTDVKLSELAHVEVEGYNHYGTVSLYFDQLDGHSDFLQSVDWSISKQEHLSNGDELTITFTCDEKQARAEKLRIDTSEATAVVDGLQDAMLVNHDVLFDGLSVEYDGMNPCIVPIIANTSTEPLLSTVEYTLDTEQTRFSSGEPIRIKAALDEEYAMSHPYILELSPDDYYMEVSAPVGDSYFTDSTQVTPEILAQLESEGFSLISKADAKEYGLRIFQQEAHIQPVFHGNTTTFQWVNPYVISAYFHSVTDTGREFLENHANDVQIVYGVTITQADGKSVLAEMVIQFVNLAQKQDGTIDLNLQSGRIVSASYRNSNIKKLVSDDGNGAYVTTKLTD